MRKFCNYFLILPYFIYSIRWILCTTLLGQFVSRQLIKHISNYHTQSFIVQIVYFTFTKCSFSAAKEVQKMHPVRSRGPHRTATTSTFFSEGTHPLREGACQKKHISSERARVWAAFCERTFEVGS